MYRNGDEVQDEQSSLMTTDTIRSDAIQVAISASKQQMNGKMRFQEEE